MEEEPLLLADRAAWERWLDAHHASSQGVWLRIARKGAALESVTHAEALEEALRYGWIDALRRRHDEVSFVQRFTPRRPRSLWSKINREKAEALIAAGRMQPAGLREVERARQDGRWEAAYDPPARATVPDDLRAALDANPRARDFFAALDGRNRYAVLFRIQTAKRADTRARRIRQFVEMLEKHEKLYP